MFVISFISPVKPVTVLLPVSIGAVFPCICTTLEHCTVACVPSEFHESYLLSFRLSVVNHGIGVVLSGANMPRDELTTAARLAHLQSVVFIRCNQAVAFIFQCTFAKAG